MRVVGWNVMQGGGARVGRIVTALEHLDGDVLVLSEHRASGPLGSVLAEAGWVHQAGAPDPVGGYASVLIASREPLTPAGPTYTDPDDGHRLVHVEVGSSGWHVLGALIPAPDDTGFGRTKRCWDFLTTELTSTIGDRPTLLIGDLNTGLRGIDELGETLQCSDDMSALINHGWTDAWRTLNPTERPPATWWSPAGNGFRLDHAFLSPGSPVPLAVDYPTEIKGEPTTRAGSPKADGERPPLSDHVPIVVDLPE